MRQPRSRCSRVSNVAGAILRGKYQLKELVARTEVDYDVEEIHTYAL
jgi:hypothetical protein